MSSPYDYEETEGLLGWFRVSASSDSNRQPALAPLTPRQYLLGVVCVSRLNERHQVLSKVMKGPTWVSNNINKLRSEYELFHGLPVS